MTIPTASMLSHMQYTSNGSNESSNDTFMSTSGAYSQIEKSPTSYYHFNDMSGNNNNNNNNGINNTPSHSNINNNNLNNMQNSPFAMNRSNFNTPNKSINSINSFTPTRSKRRNSNTENEYKKIKPLSTESTPAKNLFANNNTTDVNEINTNLTIDNINLSEYPKFHHPDGGFIQFTPIGNIRTFLSDNNVMQRIIEKNSKFDLNNLENGIDGYKILHDDHDHDHSHCCFNDDEYDCDSDEDMY